jgi:APA family basic amino acid/polyamine antiporter
LTTPDPESPRQEGIESEARTGEIPLPAGFGLSTATFVVISSMVGVGVLTTSGQMVDLVGSNALMLGLWAVGGLVALCGALSLSELAAMMPRSGGEYVFLREAYGERMGFLAGWSSVLLGFAAPVAATSRAAADYLIAPFPLRPQAAPGTAVALATVCVVGFAAIHATTRKRTARAQGLVTTTEVLILVAFVIAGLIAGRSNWRNLADLPPSIDGPLAGKLLFSLLTVSYGYTGWNAAAYLAGEVADAPRRLPAAILLGTFGVMALYLGINLVYALALPAAEIHAIREAEGEAAIVPIAERAARALFGRVWSTPFSLATGLILLATTSAYLLTGPRVVFAMARAGHFPAVASRLTERHGLPAVATSILAGLGLLLLWTSSFNAILIFAAVGLSLTSLLSVAAVYVLRYRRPDLPRPFRVPGYPVVPGIYLLGTSVVLVATFLKEPEISALSAASLLAAIPVFELCVRRRGRD